MTEPQVVSSRVTDDSEERWRLLRRVTGVLGLASFVLILSRVVWTSEVWFFPYAIFWIWTIIVSVRLLRKGGP